MKRLYYLIKHQHKADALIAALHENDWDRSFSKARSHFILSHIDHKTYHKYFDEFFRYKKKIFIYSHAARPNLFYDFYGYEIYPNITATFVSAQGHAEIMRRLGVKHSIEIIGWTLCPMRDFQKRTSFKNVLFAPIHPNYDGSLSDVDLSINRRAFSILLEMHRAKQINLSVRFVRSLTQNGISEEPSVNYIQGNLDGSYQDMDKADLVVSHSQTYAYMAVARGIPTIGAGENTLPKTGSPTKGSLYFAKSFDAYKEIMAFPYDLLTCSNPLHLFERAIESDVDIRQWKENMIGSAFDSKAFVKKVESYLW